MNVRATAGEAGLLYSDRSVIRPWMQRVRCKRLAQTLMMGPRRFESDACAGAPSDLTPEARTLAALESQKPQAQTALRGDVAQRLARSTPRAERSVEVLQIRGVDRIGADVFRRRRLIGDAQRDQIATAAQAPVVCREQLFDESRLAQKGAKLARSLLELDADDLGRQSQVVRAAIVRGKMGRHALAQVDALADVQRRRIESIEAVDARRVRDRVQRVRGKVRRKAWRSQNPGYRPVDLVGGVIPIQSLYQLPEDARVPSARWRSRDGNR